MLIILLKLNCREVINKNGVKIEILDLFDHLSSYNLCLLTSLLYQLVKIFNFTSPMGII